jgi:hypothetical protein
MLAPARSSATSSPRDGAGNSDLPAACSLSPFLDPTAFLPESEGDMPSLADADRTPIRRDVFPEGPRALFATTHYYFERRYAVFKPAFGGSIPYVIVCGGGEIFRVAIDVGR